MLNSNITIPAGVLALLRGDISARCLADRFGVTESLVYEWRDVFIVAGVLALNEHGQRSGAAARRAQGNPRHQPGHLQDPTTFECLLSDPTTVPPKCD